MTDSESDEYLVGEELIRVGLETYEVHLEFNKTVLHFWVEFWVRTGDGVATSIEPSNRRGDLVPLWNLIGATVKQCEWTDRILIVFSDGAEIEMPPHEGVPRGAALEKDRVEYVFEEF